MVDYPYTLKPSTLEDFLKNMADRPEPKKVTQPYFKSLGYTSSNDWVISPILKFINFLDSNGAPTDSFKGSRDTRKSGAVMAQNLKKSYADLFELHSNPCEATDENLENFFRTETGRGGRTLKATIAAFKVLCKFADFGATLPTPRPTPTPAPTPVPTTKPVVQVPVMKEGGVTVNVNIRLELPATKDADVYDKIFQSLQKYIITPSSKTD